MLTDYQMTVTANQFSEENRAKFDSVEDVVQFIRAQKITGRNHIVVESDGAYWLELKGGSMIRAWEREHSVMSLIKQVTPKRVTPHD
jgi:negative regulator of genetic competence, sporulation and motility